MKNVDWRQVISEILDRLIITQSELADRLNVAQQTVSTWKNGKRGPNTYSRRQLSKLANEAGVDLVLYRYDEARPPRRLALYEDSEESPPRPCSDLRELIRRLQEAPEDVRREVMEFATFKMWLRGKDTTDGKPKS